MKRIMLIFLSALLMGAGMMPCLQIGASAADNRKLWATVGENERHFKPQEYEKRLKKYTSGTQEEERNWSGWAWKNDHANSRLDFFVQQEDIPQAQLVTADLVSANGAVIKKENITATYLKAVHTLSPDYPDINYDVFDIITHKSVKDLEAGQSHQAWVDIYVPKDTAAGTYRGTLALKSGAQTLAEFTYTLEVVDMTLTDPEDWETYLDLWTYPYASNRYYSGKTIEEYFDFEGSDAEYRKVNNGASPGVNSYSLCNIHLDKQYEAGLESELELYHQAGGNAITVTLVEDPWNSRYPCPCPSMVKWTKHPDGSYTWDYTDMDYWIELNMKHHIDRQINLFYHAGVGYGFVATDENGNHSHGGGAPGSAEWNRISQAFLQDLANHLEEKGWFDITVLSMDERGYEVTEALVNIANKIHNSKGEALKVGGAVNASRVEALFDRMYDISIHDGALSGLSQNIADLAEARRANGQQTTIYTCGAGKMSTPNQPAEAAYAVYYAYQNKVDGVMRWALNKYDEDPIDGTMHPVPYPGDSYLIYPDRETMQAQSTPRYEKLCEGMRDVEKLRIIRKNYPEFADAVDRLAASLNKSNLVNEAVRMHSRVLDLSRVVIAFSHKQYIDLVDGEWYMDAVRFAAADGLMNGVSTNQFAPNASMTRAMFVTVLARLDGATLNNDAKPTFSDVPTGQWYTGAIVWAAKNDLVNGVAPGKFAPNDTLTREQTATLLYRYANYKKYDTASKADLSGYTDHNKIGDYAVDAISWANAKSIVRGVSETSLDPKGNCTRAQVAQMLRLFCKNVLGQ